MDSELFDGRHAAALKAAGEGLTATRATTISMRRISQVALKVLREVYPEAEAVHATRPRTREECQGGARPCPFVSCKYNLYLSVGRKGNVKLEQGALQPWEVKESCVLDVAERGPQTLEEVGKVMNLSRERIRQEEDATVAKLNRVMRVYGYDSVEQLVSAFEEETSIDHPDAERRKPGAGY